jgi:hypothetical protein
MAHGEFRDNQAATVAGFVKGKIVHDLGCGDLHLAHQLVKFGAEKVIAVDKSMHLPYSRLQKLQGIEFVGKYFHDFHEPVETAFLSWPVNWYDYGLGKILDRAKTVIYLGSNLDGSACGYSDMWMVLSHRNILAHIPSYTNTLIVYGSDFVKRSRVPEEQAALDQSKVYRFDEVYGVSSGDDQAPGLPG